MKECSNLLFIIYDLKKIMSADAFLFQFFKRVLRNIDQQNIRLITEKMQLDQNVFKLTTDS